MIMDRVRANWDDEDYSDLFWEDFILANVSRTRRHLRGAHVGTRFHSLIKRGVPLSGEFRVSESDRWIASVISYSASIGMALAEEAGDVNDQVRFDVQPGLTLADHLI